MSVLVYVRFTDTKYQESESVEFGPFTGVHFDRLSIEAWDANDKKICVGYYDMCDGADTWRAINGEIYIYGQDPPLNYIGYNKYDHVSFITIVEPKITEKEMNEEEDDQ
jgi:hypothetical protein